MQFRAEHQFPGSADAVAALLVDPAFHQGLQLPDLSQPEVVEADPGEEARLTLRYEFVGHLDPPARRLLGTRRLTWVQELHIDLASRSGQLTFAAEASPRRLHGQAHFRLQALPDGGSTRLLEGELVVAVPLIGSQAERRIIPGILRRLDVEAEALADRLQATPA